MLLVLLNPGVCGRFCFIVGTQEWLPQCGVLFAIAFHSFHAIAIRVKLSEYKRLDDKKRGSHRTRAKSLQKDER